MSDEKYDAFSGVHRIAGATERLDSRVSEILALHFALEREIDAMLTRLCVRPSKILSIGFSAKARLLHALFRDSDDKADKLFNVLNGFNELRNQFAHGKFEGIEKCHANLLTAFLAIDPAAEESLSYTHIAQGICLYMGGGPMPRELREMTDSLRKSLLTWAESTRSMK